MPGSVHIYWSSEKKESGHSIKNSRIIVLYKPEVRAVCYDLWVEEVQNKKNLFDNLTQIFLPGLTALGFLMTSLKNPALGLAINLSAQVFWFYSGWKAWKEAGQIGIFITAVLITIALLIGVLNYWIL